MGSESIWREKGRLERFGSCKNLERLRVKRIRQLEKLINKYEMINPEKSRRFRGRLDYTKETGGINNEGKME